MKIPVFLFFVRGNTEVADGLYADNVEEIDRYLKQNGVEVERVVKLYLDPERNGRKEFSLYYPFFLELRRKGGYLVLSYGFSSGPVIKRYLRRTGGIQVYELVSGLLVGGIAW